MIIPLIATTIINNNRRRYTGTSLSKENPKIDETSKAPEESASDFIMPIIGFLWAVMIIGLVIALFVV